MNNSYLVPLLLTLGFFFSCQPSPSSTDNERRWEEADRSSLISGLSASLDSVLQSVAPLSEEQWNWQADSNTWSIALVVEHLITHEELFYREVRVLSNLPSLPVQDGAKFASDKAIMSYSEITDQNRGKAPVYLAPKGRWCDKGMALASYQETRKAMIDFVSNTEVNLRAYYTKSGRGPTEFRDLHQLLLISIAHTNRHQQQIQAVLADERFPHQAGN